jgi:hypothetical protein
MEHESTLKFTEVVLPELNEVKKDLMKTKAMATLDGYSNGKLYYRVKIHESIYRFPIATVEKMKYTIVGKNSSGKEEPIASEVSFKSYKLSEDLGATFFASEMRGSELNRWISKAYASGDFVKVSL